VKQMMIGNDKNIRNVIIVGGGPAGYTAAIYLARATLAPLMFAGEMAGGQLMWTTEVENYPGFPDRITGPDLVDRMRKQAEKFGAEIKNVNVTKVDLSGDIKRVWVNDQEYQARSVILTTGGKPRLLEIGEKRLIGRGVSTCATCDAAFFKDKVTFVVGGGDVAMEDILALSKFAKEVTLIHRKGELRASKIMQDRALNEKKIPVLWNSEVIEVIGDQKLTGIKVKNVTTGEINELPADGLFLAIGHSPESDLFGDQLETDGHGHVVTKRSEAQSETSVEGVFGAGDVIDGRYRQIATAVGTGCKAALDCERYLTGSAQSW